MRLERVLVTAVVFLMFATVASAAIVPYDDRTQWETDVGTIDLSEEPICLSLRGIFEKKPNNQKMKKTLDMK